MSLHLFYIKGDPCHDYKTLDTKDDFSRSTGYTKHVSLCDNMLEPNWYRISSKSGERMPTECVQNGGRCGALYSIWMNGKIFIYFNFLINKMYINHT